MKDILYIDIETYSSEPLKEVGLFKYAASSDFEILLIGYAFNAEPIQIIDCASGEEWPERFETALLDPDVIKVAHNAMFERTCFKRVGYDIPSTDWTCTMILSAYCGLPLKLEDVASVLNLPTQKLNTGTLLINYFSKPCKPTKSNGGRLRNLPQHNTEKWEAFKEYLRHDVGATRDIVNYLENYKIPQFDIDLYVIDQKINDLGISVDTTFANQALLIYDHYTEKLQKELKNITGLDNPNSVAQLKSWLTVRTKKAIESLTKASVAELIKTASGPVRRVLEIRQELGKTSVKKYSAMLNCVYGSDNRIRGLFQYYGANSTGRWASRLVQLHNLPQNHIPDLELARELVLEGDDDTLEMCYGSVIDTLSQLIRTAFVSRPDHTLGVADFSAIESRVISWYANEEWRLEVFKTHGKIYEATAAKMFGIPFESITKDSEYRQRGKVAELALGFGGSKDAITRMDRKNEIPDELKPGLVRTWRKANPKIVKLWSKINTYALQAVKTRKRLICKLDFCNLIFESDGLVFSITLPSGHVLYYWEPRIGKNKFDGESVTYMNMNQVTKKWVREDTYGGKLVENIVQATARDLLGHNMIKMDKLNYNMVIHVHDEIGCEIPKHASKEGLQAMLNTLCEDVEWAPNLPMAAAGYLTDFYRKD